MGGGEESESLAFYRTMSCSIVSCNKLHQMGQISVSMIVGPQPGFLNRGTRSHKWTFSPKRGTFGLNFHTKPPFSAKTWPFCWFFGVYGLSFLFKYFKPGRLCIKIKLSQFSLGRIKKQSCFSAGGFSKFDEGGRYFFFFFLCEWAIQIYQMQM